MPKDSHMLPPWSQALLRAARMGQVLRPAAAPVEEEKEPGEDEDAEGDIELGFPATRWGLVPSHLEGKEIKFLADRRKGLPPLDASVSGAVVGPAHTRKTKIRKTDEEGHVSVFEVIVAEGQAVEGEIMEEDTTISEPPAPGTVVEGLGVVNAEGLVVAGDQIQPTPPRRRPPPPRRRPKGPGRGRKKKVVFASGPGGPLPHGTSISNDSAAAHDRELRAESEGDRITTGGDIEMGEDSMLRDGSDGSEEEDEGEDGEEGDKEELSPTPMSNSKSPSRESTKPEPVNDEGAPLTNLAVSSIAAEREPSSSPDLPLAASQSFPAPQAQTEALPMLTDTLQSHVEPPIIHVEAPDTEDYATGVRFDAAAEIAETPTTSQIFVDNTFESVHGGTEAELQPGHNAPDGVAEPKAPAVKLDVLEYIGDFPDGEEDLLGSLERHLDKQG